MVRPIKNHNGITSLETTNANCFNAYGKSSWMTLGPLHPVVENHVEQGATAPVEANQAASHHPLPAMG